MEPGAHDSVWEFQQYSEDALDLPPDLRARMSNVEIVIEDEPLEARRCLVSIDDLSTPFGGTPLSSTT
jgi:predicted Zn-dependent protease with MMP-like domain